MLIYRPPAPRKPAFCPRNIWDIPGTHLGHDEDAGESVYLCGHISTMRHMYAPTKIAPDSGEKALELVVLFARKATIFLNDGVEHPNGRIQIDGLEHAQKSADDIEVNTCP